MLEDDEYAYFYEQCGNKAGDWIILDNSAHEFGAGSDIEDLLLNAIHLKAREIVIPDTLFHAMYTVEKGREAFKFLAQSDLFKACSPTPRLMVVPQGRDVTDWAWCLKDLVDCAEAWGFGGLLTIGLSKDYEDYPGFPGKLQYLIHNHLGPLHATKGIPTHLLGWPCNWNLIHLARQYPCLRSTDTAKPFIYAMDGVLLSHEEIPPRRRRPDEYFYTPMFEDQVLRAAYCNVTTFKLASRGVRMMPGSEASLVTGTP